MKTNLYFSTRKLRTRLALLAAGLLLAPAAWGQAPANDDCSGAIALTPGTTCTVTTSTNLNATASPSGTPAPSCAGTSTTGSNDVWYSIVVPATGGITVITSEVSGSDFDDTVLELYSGTCGNLASLSCNDDAPDGADGFSSVTITGQPAGTTIYARVFGYGLTPTGQFSICATILPANDAAVRALYSVGKAPVAVPQAVQAVIRNTGASALLNVPVTLSVTGSTTFTDAKIIPSLAAGASTTVTFAAYTPVVVGVSTLTVTVPADNLASNNTQTYTQAVTANNLSYIEDSQPIDGAFGIDPTSPNGIFAVKYTISSTTNLGEVRLNFPALASTTSRYQVVVLNATSTGTPGSIIFTSATQNRPTTAGVVVVPVTGTVAVNGSFFVGVKEIAGGVQLGYQIENPLRPNTFYVQEGGTTTWDDLGAFSFPLRLAIEVGFNRVLSTTNSGLARALMIYPNPAHQVFTLRLPAIAGQRTAQLTLLNTLGQQVQTRTIQLTATGTETQVDVRGLATGLYTLRIQTNNQMDTKQVVIE